ncbi:hypothetical protein [Pectobacterium aroidearum]|uniref:hypothetical protein n=1 Tax=Pectobacterium aroidearum TaxID=1201031 RepID=UPI0032EC5C3E
MLGPLGGSLIGFGAGKLIEVPLKPIFNNVRNEYGNIPVIYPWITTGKPKSPIPGTVGGLGGSVGAEVGGKYTKNKVKDMKNDKINLIMFVYLIVFYAFLMFFYSFY